METLLNDRMPASLSRLPELAYNLWWSWTPEARTMFRQLDYPLWRKTNHNPVRMLQEIAPEQLEEIAEDPSFLRLYKKAMMLMDKDMSFAGSWFSESYPEQANDVIAYFSAEFGLHNSIPIYSGGLGILSGDHAKEASDLGIPLVGIGFLYPQGYFRQHIPNHGWQEAIYDQLDITKAAIQPALDPDGNEIKISVRIGDRDVHARVWHVRVGRTPLYLMDTDVDENDPWNRELSARLYSGDSEMRIRQEMLLGIGGVRVIRTLGFSPKAWHMNEGHSAFLVLECIREKVATGLTFEQAAEEVRNRAIFTTHTPVPAGHDAFAFQVVEKYFRGYWEELGISLEQLLAIGSHREAWGTAFNMTVLALRMSGQSNGVSELHGEVSRNMWQGVWPDTPPESNPITHVTNGVHMPTWISAGLYDLHKLYLGPQWIKNQDDPQIWEKMANVPDEVLWDLHMIMKGKLISFITDNARRRWLTGNTDPAQILTGGTLLDPNALTIGFARRFATYKRATLIFRDIERLRRIMLNTHRPVQFVFAGKAHPADDPGKSMIQQVYNMAKSHEMGGRVAFIEDYNMHSAHYLVQGVDVWMNNPRRPREASGTSGMKAAMNGIPNLSILDGWWVEGYNGANGWTIGSQEPFDSNEEEDNVDANAIYELLENEIVPLYYARDRDGIPRGWVEVMRESIRSVSPQFSMSRMLKDYTEKLYINALRVPDPGHAD